MNLTNFRFETDADGIAVATWDMPGRSMNVITPEVMEELNQIVDKVAGDEAIKGCVITSGKESFSGGADLTMLQGLRDLYVTLAKEKGEAVAMQSFFDESRKLSLLYRKLETCGKPFAAAIHGICLGGGLLVVPVCHRVRGGQLIADELQPQRGRVGRCSMPFFHKIAPMQILCQRRQRLHFQQRYHQQIQREIRF